jgi:MFS family permease
MLAWLRDLTSRERRTMLACWGGWTLDGFDQQLYSYVVPTVIAVWGMSTGAAGTIGTVTVVTSSFGGWFAGALADRFGRVRMLQIAILWYSVFTFLCSFAQNFEQLFILRGLHGLGFGGEWATGAVLMGEVIRDKYRGRGVGFVQTGAAVGPGLAALVYAGLYAILPEAIAWRALFAVGILPGLLVLWIRRSIPESEAFQGQRDSSAQPGIAHLLSAFRGPYLWLTIKVSLMVMGAQGGVWAVNFWMPTYLRTVRHLSASGTGLYVAVQAFGALIGFLIGAYLDVHDLGHRNHRYGARLSLHAGRRYRSPAPRDSAQCCDPDEVRADGPVHDGALPDQHPRHRARFLLQCRPGDRLGIHDRNRFCDGSNAARHGDRAVLDVSPYADDRHAAAAPGDARPRHREPRGRHASFRSAVGRS